MDVPMSLRTKQGEIDYQKAKTDGDTVPLADEKAIKDYVYWKLIANRFPPKVAFQTSHMLITRRVVPDWSDLTAFEYAELTEIIKELEPKYDQLTMNFPRNRSVPGHFHLHLNKFYDNREEMSL